MSGFSADWLALREPADRRARDPRLLDLASTHALAQGGLVLDLGCGTGATFRAFGDRLPDAARWRLLDRDEALLSEAVRRHPGVGTDARDLSDPAALPLDGVGLVTASALFDLASASFIDRFCEALSRRGVALYAALSVDGRLDFEPADDADDAILAAFRAHQGRDKGLGAALGPTAARHLENALRRRGYRIDTAPSDWRLGQGDGALQAELLRGKAQAAMETGLVPKAAVEAWLSRRLASVASGKCSMLVGHRDLFARREPLPQP